MKFNTALPILDLKGKPMMMADASKPGEKSEPFTVGDALSNALVGGPYQGDAPDEKEKLARFRLALLVGSGNIENITDADSVRCRAIASIAFTPLVCGRIHEILDNVNNGTGAKKTS